MEKGKQYQSFSGSDIVATFNGQVVGELLSLTYSITREKGPNYVMGNANPVGYARGKRGIAGNLVFGVFDRNALLDELRNPDGDEGSDIGEISTFKGNDSDGNVITPYGVKTGDDDNSVEKDSGVYNPEQFNDYLQNAANGSANELDVATTSIDAQYADQLKPFDITINFQNEMGNQAKMTLYGVEILNEGMGFSIQDLSTNVQYSFVARDIEEIHELEG